MEERINDIQEHEKKLMEKVFGFTEKLAKIEAHQESLDKTLAEQKESFDKHLDSVQSKILQEMQIAFGGRLTDTNNFILNQQKTLEKITEIQSRQTEQINSINKTLQDFADIKEDSAKHSKEIAELRGSVQTLLENQKSEAELQKERVKGRWAAIGTAITSIAAIITAIISAILASGV